MHRQTGSGPVRHGPHSAGRLGLGLLDGILLAILVRRDGTSRIGRILIVGKTIGELETQIVDHGIGDRVVAGDGIAVLIHATVGEHGLAAGRDIGAGIRLPIIGMVPCGMVTLGGVHGIGMGRDDGTDLAGLVTVLRAGARHVHAAHLQRLQMVLVRSDEHLHAAGVALGTAGMTDAHGVGHARLRVDGLADGPAAMHVRAHVAVLLPMQLERRGLMVAAGQFLPAERRLAQSGDLMLRSTRINVVVI